MNRGESLAFCDILYSECLDLDDDLHVQVASITPGKRGKLGYTFCRTTAAAADTAQRIANENSNAYACMSLVNPKTIKTKRGKAEDARAIVGFWSDIDIADPAAPKPGKNPPVNFAEAMAIAKGVGATPSVIVHSGHGLHAYWLFDKPWVFTDDDERKFAGDVAKSWHITVQQVARDHGRALDSVFDLARVLRIPGTINTKNEVMPVDVKMIWPPEGHYHRVKRYPRGELESLIRAPAEDQAGDIVVAHKLKDVEFRFPDELERAKMESKIAIASMNDRTFKDTWERTRVDFASTQHSPSEYDMSIANQMIATGWAEQEVFWTIVLWREKHSEDLDKVLKRTDYIELTFAKAKKGNVVSVAVRNIADITATVQQLQAVEPDSLDKQEEIDAQIEHNRQRAFEEVSSLIGTTLTGFHREGVGKGCNYYLQFGQKKVLVGEVDDLFNIKNVRHCIYNEADIVVGKIKDVDWWGAMQLLTSFRTEKMNPSLSPTYRWMTFLLNYVERAPVIPDKKHDAEKEGKERRHTALMRSKPYWQTYQENGTADSTYRKLFFHLESLRNHAQKYYGDRTPHNDVVDAIHALGGIPEHVNHMHKGKRIHRYLWAIPASEIAKHTAFVQKETTKDDTTNETRETTEPDN